MDRKVLAMDYSKSRDQNPLKSGDINCDDFISLPCTGGGEDCGRAITIIGQRY